MTEVEIVPYDSGMNGPCLELERLCPQGKAFRLSFRRDYFHKRAENFLEWRIFVAMKEGVIVGVVATAIKDLVLRGKPQKGAIYFDLRVHPDHRHQGIAQRLGWTAKDWSLKRGAEYHYLSCVDDNRAMLAIGSLVNGTKVGGYGVLVWPVYRRLSVEGRSIDSPAREVHEICVEMNGPYDLYSDPFVGGKLQGLIGSFMTKDAGCSLWSTAGILEERIERIPSYLSALRKATRSWPLNIRGWPDIPGIGDVIKGLYVYDLYGEDSNAIRNLMHHVNNWALDNGKHHLYIIDAKDPGIIGDLRRGLPKAFSPVLRFSILSHTPGYLDNMYIDVRDL